MLCPRIKLLEQLTDLAVKLAGNFGNGGGEGVVAENILREERAHTQITEIHGPQGWN